MRCEKTKYYHDQFGEFVKGVRESRCLSQSELANLIGATQSYISRIETGDRDIDLAVALKVCDVLNVDMKDFIDRLK